MAKEQKLSAWRTFELERKVPAQLREELQRRIFFIDDAIQDFECLGVAGNVEKLRLLSALSPIEAKTVFAKIERVIKTEVLALRLPNKQFVWQNLAQKDRAPIVEIYEELLSRGLVIELGEGQVGLAEPLLSLMDGLDARLRAIGLSFPNATEYRYPTLIPSHVLERSGYFQSFPQFLMFVTRLHNDMDVYDDFLDAVCGCQGLPQNLFEYCSNKDYCLPPTMCYHYFNQMTDQNISGNQVVTARGKSFRYESKYSRGLSRLWDFTIREIVFIGDKDFVLSTRENLMTKAFSLMEKLNLSGSCAVANDPFFASNETVMRIGAQQLMALKYELCLDTSPSETVAIASFNLHDQHFTGAFDISKTSGERPLSGCVGFGLERLTYSFLCQHGFEPSAWPELPAIEQNEVQ